MIICVVQGKGGKDRNVMLSPSLLDLLRTWWRATRPRGWPFAGRDPAQPMTTPQLNPACHAPALMAEINERVSLRTLRHYVSFLTMSGTLGFALGIPANFPVTEALPFFRRPSPSLERFKRWSVSAPAILVCLQPRLLSCRALRRFYQAGRHTAK
jgi:hypothetical protein